MNNKVLTVFVIILSLIAAYLLFQNIQLQSQVDRYVKTPVKTDSTKTTEEEEEEFEVAPLMGRMQIYANKLWFAGDGGNWDLAAFYFEEIEEVMEEIEKTDAKENDVSLSTAVKEWGLTPLENLEKAIVAKDKKLFSLEYTNMTINCSGCHVATKHPYIKIIQPTTPIFTNQKYSSQ